MLNIGIVGLGNMGRVHARHYRNIPEANLAAVYDVKNERLQPFASEYGGEPAASFEELLRRCDAVDICTPTPTHRQLALQALDAGKHVICEKPMCLTVEECREVAAAAERARRVFMPAHVLRFFPEFALAHRLVKDGEVGTPAAIRTHRGGSFPKWSSGWFGDYSQSGGVLLDLVIHDFDWLRWTFGEVERVFAKALVHRNIPQCDYALTTLKFRSGAVAHVEGTWADPGGFRVWFEIAGDGGFVEYDSRDNPTFSIAKRSTDDTPVVPQRESPLMPHDDPYRQELAHFVECVTTGRQPDINAEDGLRAVAISRAALESARTGEPVGLGGGQ